jgi:hypothetical protein
MNKKIKFKNFTAREKILLNLLECGQEETLKEIESIKHYKRRYHLRNLFYQIINNIK